MFDLVLIFTGVMERGTLGVSLALVFATDSHARELFEYEIIITCSALRSAENEKK